MAERRRTDPGPCWGPGCDQPERPNPIEQIEAAIWAAGATDAAAVNHALDLIADYARAADCPPDPMARRAVLAAAVPDGRRRR
jgi:hypothetical protein